MWNDPIVDELHKLREEHGAQFDYDVYVIVANLIEEQKQDGRTYVSLPRKNRTPLDKTGQRETLNEPIAISVAKKSAS